MWIKTTAFLNLKERSMSMYYQARLHEWVEREVREHGLVRVDLFPGTGSRDPETIAEAALTLLRGNSNEQDVSSQDL